MSTKHLLLELEQLDHQAGERLVGGGLGLDVLRRRQHRLGFRAEPQSRQDSQKFSVCV